MRSRLRIQQIQIARRSQRGIALATALILLIVVTLIGLAAIRGTTLQQRMTANFYDREIGFQSAEAALRAGEARLSDTTNPLLDGEFRNCQVEGATAVVCLANPFSDPNLAAALIQDVADAPDETSFGFEASANAAGQPQYVIELLCGGPDGTEPCSGDGEASPCQSANCQSYGTEDIPPSPFAYYRITARSSDPTSAEGAGRAIVTLQAVFQVPLESP